MLKRPCITRHLTTHRSLSAVDLRLSWFQIIMSLWPRSEMKQEFMCQKRKSGGAHRSDVDIKERNQMLQCQYLITPYFPASFTTCCRYPLAPFSSCRARELWIRYLSSCLLEVVQKTSRIMWRCGYHHVAPLLTNITEERIPFLLFLCNVVVPSFVFRSRQSTLGCTGIILFALPTHFETSFSLWLLAR